MKPDEFSRALTNALIDHGVRESFARAQATKLAASENENARRLIASCSSYAKIDELASSLAAKIIDRFPEAKSPEKVDSETALSIDDALGRAFAASEGAAGEAKNPPTAPEQSMSDTIVAPAIKRGPSALAPTVIADDDDDEEEIIDIRPKKDEFAEYAPDRNMLTKMGLDHSSYDAEAIEEREKTDDDFLPPLPTIRESEYGRHRFITTAVCLSPFILIAFLVFFGAWGILFAAEAALIVGFIAALVAVSAAGTLASIAGIIYGIVMLSVRSGEGIFEIGLGIILASVTLLCAVLFYNAALRLMPYLIRKTAYLTRLCTRLVHIRVRLIRGRFSER